MYLEELKKIVTYALEKCGFVIEARIIISNRPDLCDYQCDDCFKIAKIYHKNPLAVGEEIVKCLKELTNIEETFKDIELVKPGFINFKLSDNFINKYIIVMNNTDHFGMQKKEKDELFYIDYGGANIAKPLHVGHMRPAIIGESLKRIINFAGYKTLGDAHLGDYGLQLGEVIYGILRDFPNTDVQNIKFDIAYLDKTYPAMSKLCKENEEVLKECQKITKDLQDGNPNYVLLWKQICEISIKDLKRLYAYLGVDFDFWYGESECYPIIPEMKEYLEHLGIVEVSNGAKVIPIKEATDQKELPPFLLEKSDGASLYSTTDLACIYERMQRFNPNHILYVVDKRQSLHFEQVFRAAKKANMTPNTSLEHIGFGTINGPDGKPFKTRSGETLKLDQLITDVKVAFLNLKETNKDMSDDDINKIVNAIIKFADLQNNWSRDYIFDIEKFSSVIGKTGPYILYTYLRINKIIKDIDITKDLTNNIYNEYDRNLRLKLLELESIITDAVKDRMPSYVAEYLYSLCVIVNNFYQNNYLTNLDDKQKKNDWIIILTLTNRIIKVLLNLLVIDIPTVM
ncbi:MAG: arginine--tRNA ligase [Bacilli bacterium]